MMIQDMINAREAIETKLPGDPLMIAPGRVEVVQDVIAEKLDEMAELCTHWSRNRDKGRNPSAIRAALLMLAEEVVVLCGSCIHPEKKLAIERLRAEGIAP